MLPFGYVDMLDMLLETCFRYVYIYIDMLLETFCWKSLYVGYVVGNLLLVCLLKLFSNVCVDL